MLIVKFLVTEAVQLYSGIETGVLVFRVGNGFAPPDPKVESNVVCCVIPSPVRLWWRA